MVKGVSNDAVYYALIIIFLGFTLYLLSPALFRFQPTAPGPSIISSPTDFPQVNLTILTSSNCKALCDTAPMEAAIRRSFVNVNVRTLNVETPAGGEIASLHGLFIVPAYILDSGSQRNPGFSSFSQFLRLSEGSYVLSSIESGTGYLFRNQQSVLPELTLFITSYDPPSLNFQNATLNVLGRLNNSINVTLHYVVAYENGSLSSVNGLSELVENAIQVCAFQSGHSNALNAVNCRAREILGCYNTSQAATFCAQFWKLCMQGWGLDEVEIEQCVKTRNETLLIREAEIATQNSIGVVPTTIIGNQYRILGQVSEQKLFSILCGVYSSLPGCSIRVSGNSTVS